MTYWQVELEDQRTLTRQVAVAASQRRIHSDSIYLLSELDVLPAYSLSCVLYRLDDEIHLTSNVELSRLQAGECCIHGFSDCNQVIHVLCTFLFVGGHLRF